MDPIRGRGTSFNSTSRFERLDYDSTDWDVVQLPEGPEGNGRPHPRTQFFKDHSRTILTQNDSPDIGFTFSINPYRGCEHGCAYCYARPTHEYLGLSAGIDFETKIFVKEDAAKLLRAALMKPSWKPEFIAISGVTDCYQPCERYFKITRQCLEVLTEFRNPFGIISKNALVTRDIDLLSEMAKHGAAAAFISVTTLDHELCGLLEPRTSRPKARLDAIRQLTEAGIPTGVMLAPMIPGLTDHEILEILKAARRAGARFATMVPLRLPGAVAPIFTDWLQAHRPEAANKILNRVRSLRGGKLYNSQFGKRMQGEGVFAEQISAVFDLYSRREGFLESGPELSTAHFQRPNSQMSLF